MILLILASCFFIGLHVLPRATGTRADMVSFMGEGAYKALFASLSLSMLALMVYGRLHADVIQVWNQTNSAALVTFAVMPLAFVLALSAYFSTNIKRYVDFPFLWAVMLWGFCHIAVTGDVASIAFFGAFVLLALFEMKVLEPDPRPTKEESASKDFWVLFTSVVLYSFALWAHGFSVI